MMLLSTFPTAAEFLEAAGPALQAQEAANNLIYGMALRAQKFPERFIDPPPYFAVVRRGSELLAAALMTPLHNLVVYAGDETGSARAFDRVAFDLRQHNWPVPGVLGPRAAALAFAGAWQRLCGQGYTLAVHERVYELRQVVPPSQPDGKMRLAGPADLDLLTGWLLSFHREAVPQEPISPDDARASAQMKIDDQDLFVWDAAGPVALAGRNRPTPHGYCIGPVYTPPQFRGRGYATALTAALSQLLLDSGKQFTCLFTDLANPTSNSIYQKIGYTPVCDFDQYRFVAAGATTRAEE
jgi:uncharacterized protein